MDETATDFRVAATPATLRKQVEDKLRQAIVTGYFKPGAHLSDRALCEMFQVSRTLVREAIRQLEAEGLIETLLHRGSFVRVMSSAEAAQIYDVRGVLEALAAKGFARNASSAQVAELKAVFMELKKLSTARKAANVLSVKQRFYEVLLEGSGNDYVTRMLGQILNRNTLLRATSLSDPERLPNTVQEIGALIAAIEKRDEQAAWDASLEHVRSAAKVAIDVLKRQEAELGGDGRKTPRKAVPAGSADQGG
ncbi:GntR family transcriptional regulator [Agaricicola taiwanensis]|uniref:GntR family transcriptional regulator n=1 Tax=Agaricicola taiwanensis TaxID=591372 RepID=A0A8J2YLB8_9RHOB|nr:GntR family transcriptional regulator [Agaricicola taiwanensis]GGE51541.1 GntR family transcriptional regulator [Agaricicola taiwanensis]